MASRVTSAPIPSPGRMRTFNSMEAGIIPRRYLEFGSEEGVALLLLRAKGLLPVIPRGHWRGILGQLQGEGATCRPRPRAPRGLRPRLRRALSPPESPPPNGMDDRGPSVL